jgi:hypothetical protein
MELHRTKNNGVEEGDDGEDVGPAHPTVPQAVVVCLQDNMGSQYINRSEKAYLVPCTAPKNCCPDIL